MSMSRIVPSLICADVMSPAAIAEPLSATPSAIIATIIAGVKRLPFNMRKSPFGETVTRRQDAAGSMRGRYGWPGQGG
jgi:hypothetical protein